MKKEKEINWEDYRKDLGMLVDLLGIQEILNLRLEGLSENLWVGLTILIKKYLLELLKSKLKKIQTFFLIWRDLNGKKNRDDFSPLSSLIIISMSLAQAS